MGRHRKKSEDTVAKSFEELLGQVVSTFGTRYDDREPVDENRTSLREVADHCDITMLKARKILITADMYSTHTSCTVQKLVAEGKTIPEIMRITGLSRASVHSYIPYSKVVYNLKERSVSADRMKHSRDRRKLCKKSCEKLPSMDKNDAEIALWELIEEHEGCVFHTAKNLKFRYKVKGGEIFIDRKKDSITRATVNMAFHAALELDGNVSGPKKLGTFGASYLYPIFVRFGIIKNLEK